MNDLFPILAVETSGELCSVALLLDKKNFVEMNYLQKHIHSQKLIGMLDILFATSEVKLSEVKSIAVSMGPGSFTGLRIGLSAVKGIAFGGNIPIVPVPTLDAYAFQIGKYFPDKTNFAIAVNASIDELYFSKFGKKGSSIEVLDDLKLIEKKDLENILDSGELVYGNVGLTERVNPVLGPTAKSIGEWAYLYGRDLVTFDHDLIEPNYFKNFIVKVRK